MNPNQTVLERAFELAGSGACRSVSDLKSQLQHEGYDVYQVEGRQLHQQLRDLIATAKVPDPDRS